MGKDRANNIYTKIMAMVENSIHRKYNEKMHSKLTTVVWVSEIDFPPTFIQFKTFCDKHILFLIKKNSF